MARPNYSARRLLGAVALLGLFAMHGLSAHGTGHHGTDHHEMDSMAGVQTVAPVELVSAADPAPDPSMMGVIGLCLAVLLLGVIAIAVAGREYVIARAVRLLTEVWPERARRDRAPPDLFALSIQRC